MILEVKEVDCGYIKAKPLLTYVNFSVEAGGICVILGPNGCGKTTLFKSVLGVLPPLKGEVSIDGEDTSKWSAAKIASHMAYVSQAHTPPFPYQVKDVVLLGRVNKVGYLGQPTAHDYNIVENALEDMGIAHLRNKPYTQISGGELQMVMIARALAQEPHFLVLDEPTASLDYGNVVRTIEKVRTLAERGLGVIMTTHSPDHAFMCNSDVVLLRKEAPMRFGKAVDIITEKNMKEAYGINVKIVEFITTRKEIMRMCSPVF
jgi:iron complex transport system ATP-binding protein